MNVHAPAKKHHWYQIHSTRVQIQVRHLYNRSSLILSNKKSSGGSKPPDELAASSGDFKVA